MHKLGDLPATVMVEGAAAYTWKPCVHPDNATLDAAIMIPSVAPAGCNTPVAADGGNTYAGYGSLPDIYYVRFKFDEWKRPLLGDMGERALKDDVVANHVAVMKAVSALSPALVEQDAVKRMRETLPQETDQRIREMEERLAAMETRLSTMQRLEDSKAKATRQ